MNEDHVPTFLIFSGGFIWGSTGLFECPVESNIYFFMGNIRKSGVN